MPAPAASDRDPVALRCEGLVKRYPDVVAVDGLDLEVRRHECLGLLGPNGAGKTTTVEILEGLVAPDAGVVEVLGERWGRAGGRAARALRERLGVALQETQLPERLTVVEVVSLFRSFYRRGRDPDRVISLLGLQEKRTGRIGKLSGGQKQRVALACALVSDPELLFLDEPTTGLDPQARRRIWEVTEAYLERGGTVLLTTHYMEEAARLCHRVAIVDRGRVVALDTPERLVASLGADQIVSFEVDGTVADEVLLALPGVAGVDRRGDLHQLRVRDIGQSLPALVAALGERSLRVMGLTTHEASLEDVFVHLTGRELRDG